MLCKPQHITTSDGERADGDMEGPGEEETQNQDYQPASVQGQAAQGLVNHRVPGPLTQPGAGAQQLLWCSIP